MPVTAARRASLVVALLLASAGTAGADIGLPMVAVYLPPAWLCLIPIVALEAYVGVARLKVPLRRALVAQAVANGVSTGVGMPLTWIILAVIQLKCCGNAMGLGSFAMRAYAVTIQAPWLVPYEADLRWMVPIAFLSLTVPFYAMSVAVEYLVLRLLCRDIGKGPAWSWVWRANLWSYAFLVAVMLVGMVWPAPFEWVGNALAPVVRAIFGTVYWIIRGEALPF